MYTGYSNGMQRNQMLTPATFAMTRAIVNDALNDVVIEAVSMHQPPSFKGKRLKIYFTHQTGNNPPKITFEVNNKKLVHFSYERYLENELRKAFELEGTPIILQFKNKND